MSRLMIRCPKTRQAISTGREVVIREVASLLHSLSFFPAPCAPPDHTLSPLAPFLYTALRARGAPDVGCLDSTCLHLAVSVRFADFIENTRRI